MLSYIQTSNCDGSKEQKKKLLRIGELNPGLPGISSETSTKIIRFHDLYMSLKAE